MTRVVLGGLNPTRWEPNGFADAHVRIILPGGGAAGRPRTRTYTVRFHDPDSGQLGLDLFDHGRPSLARSWLGTLRTGDPVLVQGPGGGYRPRADADWHLLAGDAVALPAIAVALESMTPDMRATVVLEVTDRDDEQRLRTAADADVRWVHRSSGGDLVAAVRALTFPPGQAQAFVHGEGGAIQELRRHLLHERGMARETLSISGYWRRGLDDEQWRTVKAATEADLYPVTVPGGGA